MFKMNSFVKKCLGPCLLLPLAIVAWPAQPAVNFGRLPLWFESGCGQLDASFSFVAHGRDSEFLLSSAGAEITLREAGGKSISARMQFVGANPSALISGDAPMAGKINYLLGNDPAQWRSGLSTFGQVRVDQVYPGVNLVYYGNEEKLEYDLDLEPGVNPHTIALRFDGADQVSVNARGDLVVRLDGRNIIQHQPVAYQISSGARHPVQVGYRLVDSHTVTFAVGACDPDLPLVIDPVIAYSTFFGGNNNDAAWAVALGTNDNSVYLAGQTLSTTISGTNRFTTPGAFQTNYPGGGIYGDAFIAKFDSTGTNLLYCTYLGGSGGDAATCLAVDGAGHAFVAGTTLSPNFPVTNYVVYGSYTGSNISGQIQHNVGLYPNDVFVSELETNGSRLLYSTYLGGTANDGALGLAVDSTGNAYVTGYTYSTNFPVTANALQPKFASVNNLYLGCNAFVSEIPVGGKTLNYSSYLGGTNVDVGYAIACNNGYVAVAGATCSSNFPVINSIQQYLSTNYVNGSLLNGSTNNQNNNLQILAFDYDAFVTLFQSGGTNLTPLYSTFLGGTNTDLAYGVAVNPSGTVYVVGGTTSTNFPVTTNGLQLTSFVITNGTGLFVTNSFLTQIQWTNGQPYIGYSQVFGGYGNDIAQAVALDAAGNVFITGFTTSWTNANATTGNLIGSLTYTNAGLGYSDVFVTAIDSNFTSLLYSADFGSVNNDWGYGIAVDARDSVYIVGQTWSPAISTPNFPQVNAWEPLPPDNNNAFLTKIWLNLPAVPVLSTTLTASNLLVTWSAVPDAQIGTNSFFLESNSNLLSTVITTNLLDTNAPATFTNEIFFTNTIFATNWAVVFPPPVTATNNGIPVYTYQFRSTNGPRFFRLKSFTY